MAHIATLLIVEDEPETANLLERYFQGQGYEVLTATSGEEALALARERPPNLVVLDIRLPDIDGFEVFRQLRAHRKTREIPVIFLTERGGREDRLVGLELGAYDYIPKPFGLQELRARVQNILRRPQAEPALDRLTGLPGRPMILEHLRERAGHVEWAVVLIGLDGLKAFGERYGFIARDDAIRAVGLVLAGVNHESGDPFFLGHLGEGWFVVIGERHLLSPAAERMVARLKNVLPYFYPLQDVEKCPEDLPPLRVMTAQVQGTEGLFRHPEDVLSQLQERKRAIP
jgi:CheY-like chemotaxis protein